ncbi:S8 family serine peptidase [Oceanobacillus damuensis]|uniref:S8 family serine peptidase n=1 Tax=Oceanobacillus damuensis TaxID=937928 RepID=UPI0008320C28|nr:S8 family serine peptidase [Oceanobacillus damuensis]
MLILLLVFPQSAFATEGISSADFEKAIEDIRVQDKVKADKIPLEEKRDFIHTFSDLKENENQAKISASTSINSFTSNGDLDQDVEKIRRNYKKAENDDSKIMSLAKVNQDDVNDRGIIVKWKQGETFYASKFGLVELEVSEFMKQQNIFRVRVSESDDYDKKLQELKRESNSIFVEPDYLLESTYIPSDPYLDEQWYLEQIDMNIAWDINKGSTDVTIAVLDSGVNANHPDLQGRVLSGYDFVNEDADASDDNGHGTHVAGIIASNNDKNGIVGIDLNAKILPIKVADENGIVSLSAAVSGIYYAIERGADVINMSFGGYQYSSVQEEAIWAASNNEIVLVASAGNDGIGSALYPASYAPVINVAASDKNDQPTYFSNYGEFIDITAPGENILSTNYLGGYNFGAGTSFSAPIVSALAGLLKAEHPNWNPNEIEWALQEGAENSGGTEWNNESGFGRVNAYQAMIANLPSLENDASDVRVDAKILNADQTISDKMDLPMDVDWYRFEVNESKELSVNLSYSSNHLDLVGALYEYDGDTILDRQLIDETGMGYDEDYTTAVGPGTYYIAIYDYNNHWSKDAYNLSVTMTTNTNDDSDLVMEAEPNDYMDLADYLPYGSMGAGYFQTYDDYDYFEVDLPDNGDFLITTATDRYAYYSDPAAILLDQNGNIIDYTDLFIDEDGTLKYFSQTFSNVKAGKYYVVIVNLQSYSDTSPYIFDISYIGETEEEVPIPVASPESGNYTGQIEVELTIPDGTYINYTLDGTTPSITNGIKYSGPIKIEEDTTLKAVAIQNDKQSEVVTYEYTIDQVEIETPSASVPSGKFNNPFELELTTNLADAKIFYTLDGSTPTANHGILYEEPILIKEDTVVKAIAIHGGLISDENTFTYEFNSNTITFPDTVGHWAESEILFLAENNLITGYPNGNFGPKDNITRASAAAIIVREQGLTLDKDHNFEDVPANHWALGYIGAAAKKGIITGNGYGDFNPDAPLTRGEMAAIIVRAYNLTGESSVIFTDVDKDSWAYTYIEKLVANNITTGLPDGSYAPKKNISRSEFATMVTRVIMQEQ